MCKMEHTLYLARLCTDGYCVADCRIAVTPQHDLKSFLCLRFVYLFLSYTQRSSILSFPIAQPFPPVFPLLFHPASAPLWDRLVRETSPLPEPHHPAVPPPVLSPDFLGAVLGPSYMLTFSPNFTCSSSFFAKHNVYLPLLLIPPNPWY